MPPSNTAAWLDAAGKPLRIAPAPYPHPDPDEILIQVHAVAINPADAFQQAKGFMVNSFPFIGGCDLAGEVIEVGSAVTKLKPGQRVMAQTNAGTSGKNEAGPFQHFAVAQQLPVCPIPDGMSYEAAAVLPLAVTTAAAGLYPPTHLALGLPSLSPKQSGKTLLIWGGSSSVGCCVIQLAVASGLSVVATCSPRNFELCKMLGAVEVFDHNSETVVEDVSAVLQKGECDGAYAAISTPETLQKTAQILKNLGGGFIASAFPIDPKSSLPEGVSAKWLAYILKDNIDIAKAVWEDFLSKALASGQFVPAPEADVVGKGLEAIDGALEAWRKGVSGRKIVVSL